MLIFYIKVSKHGNMVKGTFQTQLWNGTSCSSDSSTFVENANIPQKENKEVCFHETGFEYMVKSRILEECNLYWKNYNLR